MLEAAGSYAIAIFHLPLQLMHVALNEEGNYCINGGDEVADATQLVRSICQSQRRVASLVRIMTWASTIVACQHAYYAPCTWNPDDVDPDIDVARWHLGSISEVEGRR